MSAEKRKFKRYLSNLEMAARRVDGTAFQNVEVLNLSAGGFLIRTQMDLNVDDALECQLDFPSTNLQIGLQATVRHGSKGTDGHLYGLSIAELPGMTTLSFDALLAAWFEEAEN